MTLALYDRVQETTTTAGTGSVTLAGAVSGYQSFAVVGNGNTCYYTIVNNSAWEVGIGTYSTTGPTLARTTVLSNSNGNTSPITLSGTSTVFLTYPAEKSVNLDADGVMAVGQPLGYSDTGLIATFVSTETDYNQVVIQNKSNSSTASANLNISNNVSTDTTGFAELGINSSTFTGTNSFEIAGAAYLASASTDLTIGTYGAYNIHFVTNSNDTDAMTIYDNGGISLGELTNPGIGNIACNNINLKFQQIATTGGTTALTNASPYYTQFTGTNTQTLQLPDATTCLVGTTFIFDNDSTQDVDIADGAGSVFELLVPGGFHTFVLENNSTVAGTWLRYSQVPSAVEWGTLSLNLGATVVSGGTWQGGTIQSGYGGTGLTTFTAANNALYSTGASTLTAGTLPVAAGGTGLTTLTAGYIPYGNGTSALSSSASLQFNGTYLVVGGTTPLSGATNPIAAFSSTANNYVQTYTYNASTGTSASSDFVAYADNSTDAHGWADMGFTSSTYADPTYTVTGPNEAYILGSALNSSYTGNLVYATDYTGSANAHQWYVGGFTQAKNAWKMQLTSTGLQLANALGTAYGGTGNTTGQAASVANAITFNTSGGAAAGTTYDGSAARTIDYSTVGAQATLVSGTNIKTVNGTSLLGSGNITVSTSPGGSAGQFQYNDGAGGFGATNIKYDIYNALPALMVNYNDPYAYGYLNIGTGLSSTYAALYMLNDYPGASANQGITADFGLGTGGTVSGRIGVYNTSAAFTDSYMSFSTMSGSSLGEVGRFTNTGNLIMGFGTGTQTLPTAAASGTKGVIMKGANGSSGGLIQMTTASAGSTSPILGSLEWHIMDNTGNLSGTRAAMIRTTANGVTAGKYGADMLFYTKADNISGTGTLRMAITQYGFFGLNSVGTGAKVWYYSGGYSAVEGTNYYNSGWNLYGSCANAYLNNSNSWVFNGSAGTVKALRYEANATAGTHTWYTSTATGAADAAITWTASLAIDSSYNVTGAANITAYSDETLKTNWRSLPTDFVEQLAATKSGIYDRTDIGITQVGVGAQSLRKFMPNAVEANDEGILHVAYGNAAMASAVELAKRVVEQDKRIAHLEALVSKLLGQ